MSFTVYQKIKYQKPNHYKRASGVISLKILELKQREKSGRTAKKIQITLIHHGLLASTHLNLLTLTTDQYYGLLLTCFMVDEKLF